MKIVLLIRREDDYWFDNVINLDKVVNHNHAKLASISIFLWNLNFGMKYIDFRKKVSLIPEENISQNDFDDIIPYFDYDRIDCLDPGTLVIPMDEDDWPSVNMVKELRTLSSCNIERGILWNSYFNEEGDFVEQNLPTADSCNYGLISPCELAHLKWHSKIRYGTKQEFFRFPKYLSLKKHVLTSISGLIKYANEPMIINGKEIKMSEKFKYFMGNRIKKQIDNKKHIPEEYRNSEKRYVEIVKELADTAKFDINFYNSMI